jgi:hypothetical protein
MMSTLLAEVADKEPTLLFLWLGAALPSAVSFFAARWSRWTLLVTVPAALIWVFIVLDDIWSWDVGPAIVEELGISYVIQSYICAFAPLVAVVASFFVMPHVSPNQSLQPTAGRPDE